MVFFLVNGILQLSLYTNKGNLMVAGDWINNNIPKKSSICVLDGWVTIGGFPPCEFFNYKLDNN